MTATFDNKAGALKALRKMEQERDDLEDQAKLAASCGEFDLDDALRDSAAHRAAEADRIRLMLPTLPDAQG